MHYLGSKKKHAAAIIALTCANRTKGQWYVEPFVGGGNVMNKVSQDIGPRRAGDFNKYMVALLDAVGNQGWVPPEVITYAQYVLIKNDGMRHPLVPEVAKELDVDPRLWDALVGFTGTGVTFGSQWMNSYVHSMMPRSDSTPKECTAGSDDPAWDPSNSICQQSRKAALADVEGLRDCEFIWTSFDRLEVPEGAILYCDPPYRGTQGYLDEAYLEQEDGTRDQYRWSADKFWRWANGMVERGHEVFVSEYRGPPAGSFEVPPPPALLAARKRLADLPRAMDEDAWNEQNPYDDWPGDPYAPERDNLVQEIIHHEQRVGDEMRRLAAEDWKVVWSKEVSVNYASQVGAHKIEVEKLFHKSPKGS